MCSCRLPPQYCRRRAPSDRYALAVELVVFGVGHFLERLRLRVPPPVTVTAHEVIGQKPFNPGGVGSAGQSEVNRQGRFFDAVSQVLTQLCRVQRGLLAFWIEWCSARRRRYERDA